MFFLFRPPVKPVMVHTTDENTFKGALVYRSREMLILRAAAYSQFDQNGNIIWVPLDGDICIPTEKVSFWQEGLDSALLDVVGRLAKGE